LVKPWQAFACQATHPGRQATRINGLGAAAWQATLPGCTTKQSHSLQCRKMTTVILAANHPSAEPFGTEEFHYKKKFKSYMNILKKSYK
jgi:hypothetical protein